MKSLGLRRSVRTDAGPAPYGTQTLPTLSKPVSAIVPPKKVIRALSAYRATAPQELSFLKGDFFYVIRDVINANGSEYYEAHNPVTGARGLVPRNMFEGFDKTNPVQRIATAAGPGARISTPAQMPQAGYAGPSKGTMSPKASSVFYAVVLHDFQAERTDELDAKSGDAISVVAHSNREWFVAKPIGKLGGPGLIPASFIEVRDPLTGQAVEDVDGLIDRGELPPVEEWKKATMNYKASSIALGVIDSPSAGPVPNSKFQQMALNSPGAEQRYTYGSMGPGVGYQQEEQGDLDGPLEPPEPDMSRLDVVEPLPYGTLIRAEVSSFHQENGEWLFRVNATFRPDPPSKPNPFDPTPTMSRELTLFRVYDDFYVFQIHLLRAFPVEAGRDPDRPEEIPEDDEEGPSTRILPFMPGPLYDVDETITESRRHDLDVYLKELVALREVGAESILRCELVRKFFAAREGDIENEVPLPDQDDDGDDSRERRYDDTPYSNQPQRPRQTSDYQPSYGYGGGRTNSGAEPSGYPKKPSPHPYAEAPPARRQESSGSGDHNGYPRASTASNDRYGQDDGGRYQSGYGGSNHGVTSPTLKFNNTYGSPKRRNGSPQRSPYGQNPAAPGRDRDSDYRGHGVTPSTSNTNMTRSSQGNPNSPRISQSNPNAAFVKIKIFHSSTDELIAIRVSPRVSLRQLMEKVRERLGDDVENVKYRDGMSSGGGSGGTGQFADILNDVELREWMGSGDKLVLYAE